MSLSGGGRGTRVFSPASGGGERRMRTAVGLVRRLADVGLRYRLRELQLLAVPVAAAFLPVLFDGAPATPATQATQATQALLHPLVFGLALCLMYLAANAALTLLLPWVDQHLLPVAAMLISAHYALASTPSLGWETRFPLGGALIALYTVLGVRLVSLTVSPVRPRRARAAPPVSPRTWPLWLGAALLLCATALLTLAASRTLHA